MITVTDYKYSYNTTKPKLKNEPQNKKKTVHRCLLHSNTLEKIIKNLQAWHDVAS